MKKIAHLILPYFLPRSETFIYDQLVGIEGFEHEVVTGGTDNLEVLPFKQIHAFSQENLLNRLIYRQRYRFENYYGQKIRRFLAKKIEQIKPDLVHAHFGPVGIEAAQLKEKNQLPLAVHFYGQDASAYLRGEKWIKGYQKVFQEADLIFVVSQDMQKDLTSAGFPEDKMEIIPIGIDVDKFVYRERKPLEAGEKVKFMFVGRFVEKKAPFDLIQAFKQMAASQENVELRFIGDGPLRPKMEKVVKGLGLERKVVFTGMISPEKVAAEMLANQALVLPSVVTPQGDKEATPSVLKEAMASGLPVIATRHAGIPELVEDKRNGFLVEEHDVKDLSQRMAELAANQHLWKDLGGNGRKKVEKEFNLSIQLKKQAKAYQKII